jgi:hypothetical protein
VFVVECGVLIHIWRRSPISFKHVSSRCFIFWSSKNQIAIKHRSPIKKMGHLRHIYLTCIALAKQWMWFQLSTDWIHTQNKTKETRVALANPQWKICRKWIENRTSPYLICLSEVHVTRPLKTHLPYAYCLGKAMNMENWPLHQILCLVSYGILCHLW